MKKEELILELEKEISILNNVIKIIKDDNYHIGILVNKRTLISNFIEALKNLDEEAVELREVCPECGISHYLQDLDGIRWCQECATHWTRE